MKSSRIPVFSAKKDKDFFETGAGGAMTVNGSEEAFFMFFFALFMRAPLK